MKQTRRKTLARVAWALAICLGLIILAGLIYFKIIQIPVLPATAEYTFEAGGTTDWDTDMGLKISIPPMQSGSKMQFTVEPSAPQQQPEGDFVTIHSVYDVSVISENLQETPPITYSFEIPEGVEPQAAVILYWTEEGWTLADNENGTPSGEVSSDGKYILITRKGASRYSIAEWLYEKILSHLEGLPNPPPPNPIIEAKEAKPSTDYPGCYTPPGCLVSEVSVESPIYKDIPLLGKFGATWYSIEIAATENVSISGPDLLGFSPYLDPGEKQELRIAFPYTGGQARLCLDTSKALGWAAKTWAEGLFILPDVLSNSSFVVEIIERFQGKQATIKDMWWVIKKVLIDNFWNITGNKVKFVANVVPVSINIAVYINGWIDREVPCVDITATPPPSDRIAFVSDRDGNTEIYVMDADGSHVTRLTNNPAWDRSPVWSPDGTRIAFVSNRDPNLAECWPNDEIYVMDADGSHVTRLTDNPALDWTPVWSPDGTRIAFVSTRVEPAAACQCVLCNRGIYVMDADGSHVTRLTEITPYDRDPSWSPDGRRIAFVGSTSVSVHVYTTAVIYVMDADGSHATPLSDNAALELGPAWSPDGTRIAFVSYRDSNAEIYVMDADGSHVTRLTDNPAVDLGPAWSPDGTRISFASYRDGNGEIYVMDADGSNVTRLTDNPVDDWGPVWAPISTATTELQALDRGDARSVLEWFLYAIENKDISVFENLIPEQGVIYTPVGIGEGGVHITRDQFLSDLQHRLDSSPQCYGISYLEDQSLTVWTKGWLPEWKISEFCYQGCQPFNLTSDYAGFSFDLKERELQEREWEHVVIIGEYDYWDSSIYPPLRPCNQSSLIIQSSCPSAPLQRMVVGQRGYVCTVSDSVSLREEPGRSSSKITALTTGVYFTVIGGPSCADDWSWWQIQTDDGLTGWISEGGDNIDPYFICPAP